MMRAYGVTLLLVVLAGLAAFVFPETSSAEVRGREVLSRFPFEDALLA